MASLFAAPSVDVCKYQMYHHIFTTGSDESSCLRGSILDCIFGIFLIKLVLSPAGSCRCLSLSHTPISYMMLEISSSKKGCEAFLQFALHRCQKNVNLFSLSSAIRLPTFP
jgi:hypothetical protein